MPHHRMGNYIYQLSCVSFLSFAGVLHVLDVHRYIIYAVLFLLTTYFVAYMRYGNMHYVIPTLIMTSVYGGFLYSVITTTILNYLFSPYCDHILTSVILNFSIFAICFHANSNTINKFFILFISIVSGSLYSIIWLAMHCRNN
jgi:hypothetical protein